MKRIRPACAALLAAAAAAVGPATGLAQDDEDKAEPDLEFLEYLGSWQEEDEEWFLEAELEGKHKQSRRKRKRDENEDD